MRPAARLRFPPAVAALAPFLDGVAVFLTPSPLVARLRGVPALLDALAGLVVAPLVATPEALAICLILKRRSEMARGVGFSDPSAVVGGLVGVVAV